MGGMTLRLLLRRLITMLVVVSLLPGLSEVLETVEHLIHDGHMPHSEQHEQTQLSEGHTVDVEHGCTTMAHQCACHTSMPAILADATPEPARRVVALTRRPLAAEETPLSRANAPPTPPPIA